MQPPNGASRVVNESLDTTMPQATSAGQIVSSVSLVGLRRIGENQLKGARFMKQNPQSPAAHAATGSLPVDDRTALVEGCRRRDRSAQHRLYERYADRVYRLVLKMTGNRDDAFDLSQEVFLRVFDKIDTFRGDSALSTWIHRVTVNTVLHTLRRVRRGREAGERLCRRSSPYAENTDPDVAMDLDDVLSDIPDEERAILLLRYQQELDYAAIAEVLEIPAGTVGSRLNRARKLLRQRLAGYGTDAAKRQPGRTAAPDEA